MYICRRCSNHILDGKRFCNKCGEPVRYWDPEQLWVADPIPEESVDAIDDAPIYDDEIDSEDTMPIPVLPDTVNLEDEVPEILDMASDDLQVEEKPRKVRNIRRIPQPEPRDPEPVEPVAEKTKSRKKVRKTFDPDDYEDDYDDDYEDDYDDDDQGLEHRTINKILMVVIPMFIIVGAVVCFVCGMRYQQSCNQKMSRFNAELTAYRDTISGYPELDAKYQKLYDEAKYAFESKSYSDFDELIQLMSEAENAIVKEYETKAELTGLKEFYVERLKNFKIQDSNKKQYDSIMKKLDEAIGAKDAQNYNQFKQELEELEQNIRTENENFVQSVRNEIARIDTSGLQYEELEKLQQYSVLVDEAIASDNYIEALSLLNQWLAAAKREENKLAESESRERAQSIAESKARAESESRAKAESESKAKAESESKAKEESEAAPVTSAEKQNNYYILPESGSRRLDPSEIAGLSAWEKKIARNEIYARHGRRFNDVDLQRYFDNQAWYNGTINPSDFNDGAISAVETYNAELILSME